MLFKGKRLIIPAKLRPEMLKLVHESHMGIVKSTLFAREYLFWPGMSGEIKQTVENCSACQSHRNVEQREPMIPHDIPEIPLNKISADLFKYKGRLGHP